jgi:hypothetical protein
MTQSTALPELAYYYPNPMWRQGDWIKNLILFFDGVALLVPEHIRDKPFHEDPAIATALQEQGLLKILEPEKVIDVNSAKSLATAMADIIASGKLDKLASEPSEFHELSWSRLGYMADESLAVQIHKQLKQRGLAKDSADGVSVPIHSLVRTLILVLLSQIMKQRGVALGLDLQPTTDRPEVHEALKELLDLPGTPSAGNVIASDLEIVSVDLGAVPIQDVLAFRKEHHREHKEYMRRLRAFTRELSVLPPQERVKGERERVEDIKDRAADLRKKSLKLAKKSSFALGIAGAAWKLAHHDVVGAVLAAAGAMVSVTAKTQREVGAYSYLFNAHAKFRRSARGNA